MELNEESIKQMVKEELEKFLEANPHFQKMMRQHAQDDAARSQKQGSQDQNQAAKDKAFRQAQKGQGGTRNIEFKEG